MAAATGRTVTPKIDIQALVEDWAISYFRNKATRKERRLLDQDFIRLEVDWRRVQFTHDDAVYEPEPPSPGGAGQSTPNVLFQTTFTNRTDRDQTYTFRAERTTRSTCSVTVEQACTTSVEFGVKLTTPCQILEANAGFRREMTLANSESETIEEELTWSVDSQVHVLGRHVGEAKLVILEQEYEGRFTVKSHISGRVRVIFTNLKDNNSFVKAIEGQIIEIVKQAFSKKQLQPSEALSVNGESNSLLSISRGVCRFKYGYKQMIEVDQKPINDKPH